MASLPTLSEGTVTEDVERGGRFYSDVLGGEIVLAGEPTIVALANSWIIPRSVRQKTFDRAAPTQRFGRRTQIDRRSWLRS